MGIQRRTEKEREMGDEGNERTCESNGEVGGSWKRVRNKYAEDRKPGVSAARGVGMNI